jgi:hypothetical protein
MNDPATSVLNRGADASFAPVLTENARTPIGPIDTRIPAQPAHVEVRNMNEVAAEGRLWCPAVLPTGTQGHWFYVEEGSSLICNDPACSFHGQVVHQCPLHRGCLGRINASYTAANCGKNCGAQLRG